jgi:tetratricopeptide (TPR) repeat protein
MTTIPDEPGGTAAGLLLERADAAATVSPDRAVALYRELLASIPDHVEARLHLARLLEQRDELEAAVKTLTTGLRWSPEETQFLYLRGMLLGRLRRHDQAIADLRAVLRLQPSLGPAHFELGQLCWRKGLAAEAAAHFTRSLELDPENGRAFYYLAEALNLKGDLAGADAALERAIEATPQDEKVFHLRGRVLDRLGRPEEARQMYQRSRELQDL